MKKPGAMVYLFGNPVSLIVLIGAAGYLVYQCLAEQGSGAAALIAFLAAGYAASAAKQLQKYNEWKREWDAMGGNPPQVRKGPLGLSPTLRFAIGAPIWCVAAYGLSTMGNDPSATPVIALFWLGSAIMTAVLIYRATHRHPRTPKDDNVKQSDPCVSGCLLPPPSSPSLADAYQRLPAYCHAILH